MKVVVEVPAIAPAPLNATVPALLSNDASFVSVPARVNVPDVVLNVPAEMVKLSILIAAAPNAKVPAPALVKLKALEVIAPPMVKTLAVVVMVGLVASAIVTAPVPKLSVLAAPMYVKLPCICNG